MIRNTSRAFAFIILGGLMLLGYQNCSSEHIEGSPMASSTPEAPMGLSDTEFQKLESDAVEILTRRCASCHDGSPAASEPLDILNFSTLTANKYIIPGQPQNSPLYLSIIDGVMPQGFNMANSTPQELLILRDWILHYR